jgi:asparagine synthase (glutamine-hydrolysing)
MCGIAGIIGGAPAELLPAAIQQMATAMRHRGPDSCGVISSGECLLANTRLAILDLSQRGRQPMSNAARTVWITYNGETYNASELRQNLMAKSYCFQSTTDTEVVLHLYEEYGERCVERMRGMFAFAIWDAGARKLLLARDRLGIKPLYFARQNGRYMFASELKALLASGLIARRLNPQALRIYLQLGHVPPPWSIIDGVVPLPPGHLATWQNGAWNLRPYWTLDPTPDRNNTPAAVELGDLLCEAVQKQLISDVPIVLFLSGGTDSACLGALARKAGGDNVTAMTIGFSEREFDETDLARQTARALGLPFKSVLLPPERVRSGLDECIWAMDEPTVDGVNSFWISKIAAEQGFKVAFSGQGGDELFGGYRSWKWFKRFERIAAWSRRFPSRWSHLLDRESWPYRWRKLSYLFATSDPFLASQMAVRILFLESDLRRLLASPLAETGTIDEAGDYLRDCSSQFGQRDGQERLSLMDFCVHLQPRLLRDLDAMSMSHSLEVRPAFLDDRVVEFVLRMPRSVREQPKQLLLQAVKRFLPADLLADLKSRTKRTFTLPFPIWLAHHLKPAIAQAFSTNQLAGRGILQPAAVRRIWERFQRSPDAVGWSRIWSLFVLASWCEAMDVHP